MTGIGAPPMMLILCGATILLAPVTAASLLESPKSWWSTRVTPDLYTAGRLTESQVKYASEAGFNSLVSLLTHLDSGTIGEERIPTTEEEQDIATRLSGMYFRTVIGEDEDLEYYDLETIERLTAILNEAPKPVLFHCVSSYRSTFVALSYLANQTVYDPEFEPQVDSEEFYRLGASHSYHYDSVAERETVALITGEPVVENPPAPDVTVPEWYNAYWLLKPVIKNWYIAGQIRSNYVPEFSGVFDTVVNARLQRTTPPDDEPSQEEVTLLNIEDDTGTYEDGGRQSEERLLETRIDPSKPNEYVDPESDVNYASRNFLEFGDDIGYDEVSEQQTLGSAGVNYYSTPIGK